jgi:hypothetical protein
VKTSRPGKIQARDAVVGVHAARMTTSSQSGDAGST